jgi:cytochrome P450
MLVQMKVEPDERHADPLSPPQPVAPYRDPSRNAWVLSRYRDVLAALREPRLRLRQSENLSETSDMGKIRSETLTALSAVASASGSLSARFNRQPTRHQAS